MDIEENFGDNCSSDNKEDDEILSEPLSIFKMKR